jgi:hypothetical protein
VCAQFVEIPWYTGVDVIEELGFQDFSVKLKTLFSEARVYDLIIYIASYPAKAGFGFVGLIDILSPGENVISFDQLKPHMHQFMSYVYVFPVGT